MARFLLALLMIVFCQVMGNVPMTKQTVVYIDGNLRVMEDNAGELYIYAR